MLAYVCWWGASASNYFGFCQMAQNQNNETKRLYSASVLFKHKLPTQLQKETPFFFGAGVRVCSHNFQNGRELPLKKKNACYYQQLKKHRGTETNANTENPYEAAPDLTEFHYSFVQI